MTGNFDDGAPRLSGVDMDRIVIDPSRYIVYSLVISKVVTKSW